ncbi:hypothetical protein AAER84_25370, partial [Klebsiella pneumoniae]|uniref:hypothetical protein n=1 Tax=Klebsiella pneumoniae TaxID=573 RepID=UPI003134BF86
LFIDQPNRTKEHACDHEHAADHHHSSGPAAPGAPAGWPDEFGPAAEALEAELSRAQVGGHDEIPPGVVTMN